MLKLKLDKVLIELDLRPLLRFAATMAFLLHT